MVIKMRACLRFRCDVMCCGVARTRTRMKKKTICNLFLNLLCCVLKLKT